MQLCCGGVLLLRLLGIAWSSSSSCAGPAQSEAVLSLAQPVQRQGSACRLSSSRKHGGASLRLWGPGACVWVANVGYLRSIAGGLGNCVDLM